jgi:hypothetical protein
LPNSFREFRDPSGFLRKAWIDRVLPDRYGFSRVEGSDSVRVAKLPASAALRTQTTDEKQGFMKALVGERDARILGFAMIGADAGKVMAAVQTAMLARLPYPRLRDAILAHPTMAEGLGALLSNVPPRPVHATESANVVDGSSPSPSCAQMIRRPIDAGPCLG